MWYINPIENEYFICMQILLISFAKAMKIDYQMMFAESWSFCYNTNAVSIGSAIEPGYRDCRYKNLRHFHGISCIEQSEMNLDELRSLCDQYLSIGPVILAIDTYDCPWSESYQKYHINHHCLIVDIGKDSFICIDPYLTNQQKKLNFDSLAIWRNKAYTLSIVESQAKQVDYFNELKSCIDYIDSSNYFQSLTIFKEKLLSLDSLQEEIKNYPDYFAAPLFYSLRHIANHRKCFSDFLDYLGTYIPSDNYSESSVMFRKLGFLYDTLWMQLMKQCMLKTFRKEKVLEKIDEILESEYSVYKKLSMQVRS